jgi:hypothetical protein
MTLSRYYTAVALVYFAAFLAVAFLAGGLAAHPESLRVWSLPFAGAGLGAFFTWVTIARFGNAGGSIYFLPTVGHVTFLVILAISVMRAGHV